MMRVVLLILFQWLSLGLWAQLFPVTDQYHSNHLAVNPAFAGYQNAASVTIQYRNQWVEYQDAPKTLIFSAHAPVSYNRMGLGLLINRNTTGIFSKTDIYGNYAYRYGLHDGWLALGLGFGFSLYHNRWDDLIASDDQDALLLNNPESAVLPDFSIGSCYYTNKYFIGISIPGFLSHENDAVSGKIRVKNDFSAYNYVFTGGYTFEISPVMELLPVFMVKVHPNHATQVDCKLQLGYKDKIWMGLGYRTNRILMGSIHCQINDQFRLAYSYDFNFGKLGYYQKGSHEVLLSYVFKYRRVVTSPRQF